MTDSWATLGDGDYSPDRFYAKSTDGRGHTEHVRTGFPPALIAEISRLVQSGKFPDYRTAQDVLRDAVFHRLKYLADFTGDIELRKVVDIELYLSNRAQSMATMERLEKVVADTEAVLHQALKLNDTDQLLREVQQAQVQVMSMPEPYRTRLLDVIHRFRDGEGSSNGNGNREAVDQ